MRPIGATDIQDVFEFKSDPVVTSCYGQEPHRSLDETREWVGKRIADLRTGDSLFWAIVLSENGRTIGECCLWNFDVERRCAEVGYELHAMYWNRGLMKEALSAVLTYGFAELGLHRIEAVPLNSNLASQRVLRRLGFKHEGSLKESHLFRGRYEDQMVFGLHGDDWKLTMMR